MLEHALKQLFLKKNLMEIFGRGQPDVDAVEPHENICQETNILDIF